MLYNIVLVSAKYQYESAIAKPLSLESSSCLPLHPTSLLQSLGFSSLSHIANSHWLSTLHIVIYMFPCYSLLSSHPLLPHPSPVSMSLFFIFGPPLLLCIQFHQYCLPRFHTYSLIYNICFVFLTFSLCMIGWRFIHLIRTDSNAFLFKCRVFKPTGSPGGASGNEPAWQCRRQKI